MTLTPEQQAVVIELRELTTDNGGAVLIGAGKLRMVLAVIDALTARFVTLTRDNASLTARVADLETEIEALAAVMRADDVDRKIARWTADIVADSHSVADPRPDSLIARVAERELPPVHETPGFILGPIMVADEAQPPAVNGSAPIPRAVGSTDAPPAVPTPGIPTHTWKLNKRQMETLRTIGDAPEGWGYAGRYGEINGNVAKALMRRGLVKYAYEWDHKTFEITEAGRAALADGSR